MVARSKREKKRRYSYADYCSWPEERRCELIDGEIYDMNAPLRVHQEVLLEFLLIFGTFFKGKQCKVYPAPFDVRLTHRSKNDNEIFTVVQPDISVICDHDKLDDKGCIGAPDLVVEILSPSSASYDQIKKRSLYEKVGVREFWLVHPTDMLVTIQTLEGSAYGRSEVYDRSLKATSAIFPGLEVDLAEVFGPPPSLEECPEPWRIEEIPKQTIARADASQQVSKPATRQKNAKSPGSARATKSKSPSAQKKSH